MRLKKKDLISILKKAMKSDKIYGKIIKITDIVLTHYRPAMSLANRKKYFRGSF